MVGVGIKISSVFSNQLFPKVLYGGIEGLNLIWEKFISESGRLDGYFSLLFSPDSDFVLLDKGE